MIVAAIVWPLAAFGGAYPWTLPPFLILVLGALLAVRPRVAADGDRILDASLLAALAAGGAQLVPLTPAWRHALSPHASALDAALRLDIPGAVAGWRPLTILPAATAVWLPAGAAAVALFWTARSLFAREALRRVTQWVAWTGGFVALFAVVQAWSSPRLLYWTFQPVEPGGLVFGPFVNRNHMATWLVLALPTVVGLIAVRMAARSSDRHGASALVGLLEDPKTFWLIGAAAAMLVGLITARSRSGMIGLAFAFGAALLLSRAGSRPMRRRWMVAVASAAILVGATIGDTGALLSRFEDAGTDALGGRAEIWRQTVPIVRDFPLTGTGIGTYATAMLVYQQGARTFLFNQAHDQYLHIAAEGGLMVGLPVVFAMVAFGSAALRCLRRDDSPMFWLRVGAVSAIAGVAVQSIWETGLRMPANAALCAVVAAIAVHTRE